MNRYQLNCETVEELERVLEMMITDKTRLLANGFAQVAAQNDEVIAAIMSELKKRA